MALFHTLRGDARRLDVTCAVYYNEQRKVVGIPTWKVFMEKYFAILSQCPLFSGISPGDLRAMLQCLGGKVIAVAKGGPVFLEGDRAQAVGVVLCGGVQVVQDDYYGNRSVLSILQPGESFGEAFSCAGLECMPASVFAIKDSQVLLLNCRRMLTLCAHTCRYHSLLVQNMVKGLAQKNLALTQKVRYMSQKTTKEKLLAYLLDQASSMPAQSLSSPVSGRPCGLFGGGAFGHVGRTEQTKKKRACWIQRGLGFA